MERERIDVIVVGGGLSGLAAARRLQAAGRSVVVLEARDRVGGRTLSEPLGSDIIDLGGQWVGADHRRVRALANDLGLELFEQHHAGRKVLRLGGRASTYSGTIPSLPIWSLLELELTIRRLDAMAMRLDPARPWACENAARWDSVTAHTWIIRHVRSRGARFGIETALRAIFVCEPAEISLLYVLFYIRAAGGLMPLVEIPGGAQQDRVHGGAQQLSIRMAAELDVRLEHPVQKIEHGRDGVVVSAAGTSWTARRSIVALAPALANRIDWSPALPSNRAQLMQRMPMGSVIKCVAAYDEPFWRSEGLSGEAVCDDGPIKFMFDDSPADGSQGALVGFIAGNDARRWSTRSAADRRDAVLTHWASLFGAAAGRPIAYVDRDWNAEPWSRGCYVGLMAPGTMTALGDQLRQPVGPIHWAGTETATEWAGYFEGALQAGRRAAKEVLEHV